MHEIKDDEFGVVWGGTVVNVVDADTVDVEFKRTVRVRVRDCWCAETRTRDPKEKELGMLAKEMAERVLLGRKARVIISADADSRLAQSSTSMSRFIGELLLRGVSYATCMEAAGLAGKTKASQPTVVPAPDRIREGLLPLMQPDEPDAELKKIRY